ARERRLLEQHERVERVAVLAEGALDVAVVVGVARRGEQHPVEPDATGLVVHLVLVALPLRDLDRDVELHPAPPYLRSSGPSVAHRRGCELLPAWQGGLDGVAGACSSRSRCWPCCSVAATSQPTSPTSSRGS